MTARKDPSPAAKKKSSAVAASKSAIVVASASPASLTKQEKGLLAEALRRAEETRNVVEHALLEFGRWMLVHVFDDDAKAALEARRENALWLELLNRSGGPTLRLSTKFLYVAVSIAAHDKRIQDEAWRLLEPGRKELLLPLGDEQLMRKGAQHVVAMKLSHRATRDYVRAVRAAGGKHVKVRAAAAPRFRAQVRKFRERMMEPVFQRTVTKSLTKLDASEKLEMKRELEELRAWALGLLSSLKG